MLRAAICGAGHWGTRLIESVQGNSGKIGFVAAVTRNPADKRALAERFGLTLTDSYRQVLADRAIDAVVLATPHSLRAATRRPPSPPARPPASRCKSASTAAMRRPMSI